MHGIFFLGEVCDDNFVLKKIYCKQTACLRYQSMS